MMTDPIIIRIPDVPPSNNQFIGRNQRWNYQAEKKRWRTLVALSIAQTKPMPKKPATPITRAVVHLHYCFPDRRRRDPDNYAGKFILDPLVSLGILADDSFDVVKLVLSDEVTPGNKATMVTITEVDI